MFYREQPKKRPYSFWYKVGALAWCCAVQVVHAQEAPSAEVPETNEARSLFQAGVADYEAGRYGEALGEFEQAFRLKPHPAVQVNIANCYDRLKRPVDAVEHFEAFLASGEGSVDQRAEVQIALAELSKQIGMLSLHITPTTAHINLDDGGELRHDGHWVSPGRHHLEISSPGYESAVRDIDVRPGEVAEVRVDLAREASAHAPKDTTTPAPAAVPATLPLEPPRASSGAGLATDVWVSGGATFVLGITAAVTGQLALAANREFDTNLIAVRNPMLTEFQRAGAWARGVDAANRAETLAAATDVLLVLTLVGAGVTGYLYIAGRDAEPAQAQVSVGAGHVQLRGRF
jgi:hypothetical protein